MKLMQNHGTYSIRKSGRGLVITIPQEWADENNLKAKDRLAVHSEDGILFMAKEENHD